MERVHNETGSYCYQEGFICDNNMIDSPNKIFHCLGYCGKCEKGSKWEYFVKSENRLYHNHDIKEYEG